MGLDPERKIFEKFATASIPRSFLVDKKGKIVAIEIGYSEKSFNELIKKIEKLLEKE